MTNKRTPTKLPDVELATKDWVLKEMKDTENRIEKAFHEQTQYIAQKHDALAEKYDNSFRWMVGLILSMTIAILVAVLFN